LQYCIAAVDQSHSDDQDIGIVSNEAD